MALYTTSLTDGREKTLLRRNRQQSTLCCANHHTLLHNFENFSRFQSQDEHNASTIQLLRAMAKSALQKQKKISNGETRKTDDDYFYILFGFIIRL